MRLGNKILIAIVSALVLVIAAGAIAVSWNAPCPGTAGLGAPSHTDTAQTATMRAIVRRCYGTPGKVLRIERIARPVPGAGQVLIRVHAASVNPSEWFGTTGQPRVIRVRWGIGAPDHTRLGIDVAGVIEATGPGVTRFQVGDKVFGGVGGAFAEYVLAEEQGAIVPKPENLSFEEAAAIPAAATTALQGLRDHGRIASGQRVLVNGASGGVGTYAVQIAKALGADVTGVCSTRNLELVRSIGADHVIDYTREDFTRGDRRYDLILDNVGNHSYFDLAGVTTPDGVIVTVGGPRSEPFLGPIWRVAGRKVVSYFIDQSLPFFVASINAVDLEVLADFARDGRMRPVIDRRYPLERSGEALDYLGSQRARGKVIVTLP